MKFLKYADQFADKPLYIINFLKAYAFGGVICVIGFLAEKAFESFGADAETAGIYSTLFLICAAQFLTGIGVFDVLVKIGGAGCAVPITGFANSVVAPAMDFKREGPVLGAGSKIFSLSGPVVLVGTAVSWIAGIAVLIF